MSDYIWQDGKCIPAEFSDDEVNAIYGVEKSDEAAL